MLERVPLPICGVALGVTGIANIMRIVSDLAAIPIALVAVALLAVFAARCIRYPGMLREDMRSPVLASVSGTFPMSLMLLSVYLKPCWEAAVALMLAGLALHIALIIYFTVRIVPGVRLDQVHASYYVAYVGIAAAGIAAPQLGLDEIGFATTVFGTVMAFALTAVIGYRYLHLPDLSVPERPVFCIMAAPFALCLVAYMNSVGSHQGLFVIPIWVISFILYIIVLGRIRGMIKAGFVPSHASMTFPLAISTLATYSTSVFMDSPGHLFIAAIQAVIAIFIVSFVLAEFIMHILRIGPFRPEDGSCRQDD